jgi:hypothetical protein
LRKIIGWLLLFAPFCSGAQTVRQPISVRYPGLGAYSYNFVDAFSGTANQAALAQLKSGGFGVYSERRFMLEEFNQYSAIVALPTNQSGTFALQADYFGFSGYNESQLGLAYGRKIAERVDAGIKLNYHTIQIAGYGNTGTVNVEAGAIFHLTDKFHTGFHVYNPVGGKLSKNSNEKLASVYKFGFGYEPSEKFFISSEIVKEEEQPVNVNVGLQYNLQEKIFLRTGISTQTNNSYAGVGLKLGQLRLDINAAYHPQLGITPGLLLLFNFNKAATR